LIQKYTCWFINLWGIIIMEVVLFGICLESLDLRIIWI
jgi:hypothetical protein